MRTRLFVRSIASALASIYFFTNCAFAHRAETGLWAERRKAISSAAEKPTLLAGLPAAFGPLGSIPVGRQLSAVVSQSLPPSLRKQLGALPMESAKELESLFAALPPAFGSVRKITQPSHPNGKKIVIHIQDVHLNREAQENIGRAIQELVNRKKINLVALEGAFAPIDLTPFRTLPHHDTVRNVADYLLRENKISGPVHTAFVSSADIPPFIGVDDPVHYRANVQAYRDASSKIKDVKARLKAEEATLSEQKRTTFNPGLAAFDAEIQAYRIGSASMGAYVQALSKKTAHLAPTIKNFIEALDIESSLDFSQVEAERSRLLSELLPKLDKSQTSNLVSASMGFRLGEIPSGDFYRYLENVCETSGAHLSRYPAMSAYLHYVLLTESIDGEQLLKDAKALEEQIYSELARTAEEKKLAAAARHLFLLSKLADFSMTRDEWQEYEQTRRGVPPRPRRGTVPGASGAGAAPHHKDFNADAVPTFIQNNLYGTEARPTDLSGFESFYQEASVRDNAMAENLLKAMKGQTPSVAVLITGGFHSAGINRRMNDAGVTTITYVPKITKVDTANGSAYLSVFTQEKTPLDKLFEGEKLFLASRPMVAEQSGSALLAVADAFFHPEAMRWVGPKYHVRNLSASRFSAEGDVGGRWQMIITFASQTIQRVVLHPLVMPVAFNVVLSLFVNQAFGWNGLSCALMGSLAMAIVKPRQQYAAFAEILDVFSGRFVHRHINRTRAQFIKRLAGQLLIVGAMAQALVAYGTTESPSASDMAAIGAKALVAVVGAHAFYQFIDALQRRMRIQLRLFSRQAPRLVADVLRPIIGALRPAALTLPSDEESPVPKKSRRDLFAGFKDIFRQGEASQPSKIPVLEAPRWVWAALRISPSQMSAQQMAELLASSEEEAVRRVYTYLEQRPQDRSEAEQFVEAFKRSKAETLISSDPTILNSPERLHAPRLARIIEAAIARLNVDRRGFLTSAASAIALLAGRGMTEPPTRRKRTKLRKLVDFLSGRDLDPDLDMKGVEDFLKGAQAASEAFKDILLPTRTPGGVAPSDDVDFGHPEQLPSDQPAPSVPSPEEPPTAPSGSELPSTPDIGAKPRLDNLVHVEQAYFAARSARLTGVVRPIDINPPLYEQAAEWRRRIAEEGIRFPKGFWTEEMARAMTLVTLDLIPEFRKARESGDIKEMAGLYRKHVIGYKPTDVRKYKEGGQISFFYERGGLRGFMARNQPYLAKTGSPASLLRFALPGLVDDGNPGALHSDEVENPVPLKTGAESGADSLTGNLFTIDSAAIFLVGAISLTSGVAIWIGCAALVLGIVILAARSYKKKRDETRHLAGDRQRAETFVPLFGREGWLAGTLMLDDPSPAADVIASQARQILQHVEAVDRNIQDAFVLLNLRNELTIINDLALTLARLAKKPFDANVFKEIRLGLLGICTLLESLERTNFSDDKKLRAWPSLDDFSLSLHHSKMRTALREIRAAIVLSEQALGLTTRDEIISDHFTLHDRVNDLAVEAALTLPKTDENGKVIKDWVTAYYRLPASTPGTAPLDGSLGHVMVVGGKITDDKNLGALVVWELGDRRRPDDRYIVELDGTDVLITLVRGSGDDAIPPAALPLIPEVPPMSGRAERNISLPIPGGYEIVIKHGNLIREKANGVVAPINTAFAVGGALAAVLNTIEQVRPKSEKNIYDVLFPSLGRIENPINLAPGEVMFDMRSRRKVAKTGTAVVSESIRAAGIFLGQGWDRVIAAFIRDQGDLGTDKDITEATLHALIAAEKNDLESIAMVPFGTGFGGIPAQKAAALMMPVIFQYFRNSKPRHLKKITVVMDDERQFEKFATASRYVHGNDTGSLRDASAPNSPPPAPNAITYLLDRLAGKDHAAARDRVLKWMWVEVGVAVGLPAVALGTAFGLTHFSVIEPVTAALIVLSAMIGMLDLLLKFISLHAKLYRDLIIKENRSRGEPVKWAVPSWREALFHHARGFGVYALFYFVVGLLALAVFVFPSVLDGSFSMKIFVAAATGALGLGGAGWHRRFDKEILGIGVPLRTGTDFGTDSDEEFFDMYRPHFIDDHETTGSVRIGQTIGFWIIHGIVLGAPLFALVFDNEFLKTLVMAMSYISLAATFVVARLAPENTHPPRWLRQVVLGITYWTQRSLHDAWNMAFPRFALTKPRKDRSPRVVIPRHVQILVRLSDDFQAAVLSFIADSGLGPRVRVEAGLNSAPEFAFEGDAVVIRLGKDAQKEAQKKNAKPGRLVGQLQAALQRHAGPFNEFRALLIRRAAVDWLKKPLTAGSAEWANMAEILPPDQKESWRLMIGEVGEGAMRLLGESIDPADVRTWFINQINRRWFIPQGLLFFMSIVPGSAGIHTADVARIERTEERLIHGRPVNIFYIYSFTGFTIPAVYWDTFGNILMDRRHFDAYIKPPGLARMARPAWISRRNSPTGEASIATALQWIGAHVAYDHWDTIWNDKFEEVLLEETAHAGDQYFLESKRRQEYWRVARPQFASDLVQERFKPESFVRHLHELEEFQDGVNMSLVELAAQLQRAFRAGDPRLTVIDWLDMMKRPPRNAFAGASNLTGQLAIFLIGHALQNPGRRVTKEDFAGRNVENVTALVWNIAEASPERLREAIHDVLTTELVRSPEEVVEGIERLVQGVTDPTLRTARVVLAALKDLAADDMKSFDVLRGVTRLLPPDAQASWIAFVDRTEPEVRDGLTRRPAPMVLLDLVGRLSAGFLHERLLEHGMRLGHDNSATNIAGKMVMARIESRHGPFQVGPARIPVFVLRPLWPADARMDHGFCDFGWIDVYADAIERQVADFEALARQTDLDASAAQANLRPATLKASMELYRELRRRHPNDFRDVIVDNLFLEEIKHAVDFSHAPESIRGDLRLRHDWFVTTQLKDSGIKQMFDVTMNEVTRFYLGDAVVEASARLASAACGQDPIASLLNWAGHLLVPLQQSRHPGYVYASQIMIYFLLFELADDLYIDVEALPPMSQFPDELWASSLLRIAALPVARVRLAMKAVYEEEFVRPIDEAPLPEILADGTLRYRDEPGSYRPTQLGNGAGSQRAAASGNAGAGPVAIQPGRSGLQSILDPLFLLFDRFLMGRLPQGFRRLIYVCLTVAFSPGWETKVFHKGVYMWAVDTLSASGWNSTLSIGVSLFLTAVVFAAAHTIVAWITRAQVDDWKGDFLKRLVISVVFSLPFVYSIPILSTYMEAEWVAEIIHGSYNALILFARSRTTGAGVPQTNDAIEPELVRLPSDIISQKDFFILSPVFNEAAGLMETVQMARRNHYLHRMIFIDDGSTDETREVLSSQTDVNFISFPKGRNQQKEGAIAAALTYLKIKHGEDKLPAVTVVMDGDSYLAPSRRMPSVLEGVRGGAALLIQKNYSAMTAPIDGWVKSRLSLFQWSQAMKLSFLRWLRWVSGFFGPIRVPGGIGFFNTSHLLAALEKHSKNNFEGGDVELNDLLQHQRNDSRDVFGPMYGGVRLKTELMSTLGEFWDQQIRIYRGYWNTVPGKTLVVLVACAAAIAECFRNGSADLLNGLVVILLGPPVISFCAALFSRGTLWRLLKKLPLGSIIDMDNDNGTGPQRDAPHPDDAPAARDAVDPVADGVRAEAQAVASLMMALAHNDPKSALNILMRMNSIGVGARTTNESESYQRSLRSLFQQPEFQRMVGEKIRQGLLREGRSVWSRDVEESLATVIGAALYDDTDVDAKRDQAFLFAGAVPEGESADTLRRQLIIAHWRLGPNRAVELFVPKGQREAYEKLVDGLGRVHMTSYRPGMTPEQLVRAYDLMNKTVVASGWPEADYERIAIALEDLAPRLIDVQRRAGEALAILQAIKAAA